MIKSHNHEAARVPEGPGYTSKATADPFRPIYRSPEECKSIAWILEALETALLPQRCRYIPPWQQYYLKHQKGPEDTKATVVTVGIQYPCIECPEPLQVHKRSRPPLEPSC